MSKPVIAILTLLCGAALAARAGVPQKWAAEARITMPQARAIALKVYPGKIVTEELEKEKGGSGLRYSFDIKSGKDTHEVGVDAKTGKVLENSLDNGATD